MWQFLVGGLSREMLRLGLILGCSRYTFGSFKCTCCQRDSSFQACILISGAYVACGCDTKDCTPFSMFCYGSQLKNFPREINKYNQMNRLAKIVQRVVQRYGRWEKKWLTKYLVFYIVIPEIILVAQKKQRLGGKWQFKMYRGVFIN